MSLSKATKTQRREAVSLMTQWRATGVPTLVTPREAAHIAEQAGFHGHKWDRADHGTPVALATVALTVTVGRKKVAA